MKKTMRKAGVAAMTAALVLSSSAAVGLLGIAPEKADANALSFGEESEKVFSSSTDYSATQQGNRGWYYLSGSMASPNPTSYGQATCGGVLENSWTGNNTYTLITIDKLIIGSWDASPIVKWEAPVAGSVTYEVKTSLGANSPSMTMDVYQNDTQKEKYDVSTEGETKTYTLDVAKNDGLYLIMTSTDGNCSGSEASYAITVTYNSVAGTSVSDLESAIDALPAVENATAEDYENVKSAYETAAALSGVERAFVDAEKGAKLNALKEKTYAAHVEAQLNALPEEITAENEVAVMAAREAYNGLTDGEKALISEAALNRLTAAEETISGIKIAAEFVPLVNAIPSEVTLFDKDAVLAAKAKYDSFTEEQKGYVDEALLTKLNAAIDAIAQAESEASLAFNSVLGFSSVQGANNWYYQLKDKSGNVTDLPWNSGEGRYQGGPSGFGILWGDSLHIDSVSAVVRTFVAPYDGVVDISGWLYKMSPINSEAIATLSLNGTPLTDSVHAQNQDGNNNTSYERRVSYSASNVTVVKGDKITVEYWSSVDNFNADGTHYDSVTVKYTKLYDDTFSIAHGATLSDAIPATLKVGDAVEVQDAFTVLTPQNGETYTMSVVNAAGANTDGAVFANGKIYAFMEGEYSVIVKGSNTSNVLALQNLTVTASEDVKTFSSVEDFSLTENGQDGWYYMYRTAEGAYELATGTNDDASWACGATYNRIWQTKVMLDAGSVFPVRAWKAPVGGEITLTVGGRVSSSSGASEFLVTVVAGNDSNDYVINSQVLQAFESTVTVAKGDYVYIVYVPTATGGIANSDWYSVANVVYNSITSDEANAVISEIDALPNVDEAMVSNKAAIETAYENYSALNEIEKTLIAADKVEKLNALTAAIPVIEVEALIAALPAVENVAKTDAAAIEAAYTAYLQLNETQKQAVDNYGTLVEVNNKFAALDVITAIDALPDTVTLSDKAAVVQAKNAYLVLTEAQKAYVTNLSVLTNAENVIAGLEADKEAVDAVEEKIDEIPDTVTLTDKITVNLAKSAYDALEARLQGQVDSEKVSRLNAAVQTVETLEAEAEEAQDVEDLITALPAVEDVTLANADAVAAAKTAYDALNDGQKAQVENAEKLNSLVEAIAVMQQNKEDAEAVDALIAALPQTIALTDKQAVEAAREAYDALNADAKTLVENVQALELAEAEITRLQAEADAPVGDTPPADEPGQDGGCGSVAFGSVGAITVVLGACAILVRRKDRK